ncbi:hypothetical protein [Nocardia sp. BMG51109]|uniref:hypothetical protein n=1 Tax=Nocardia sp. BMG51109 TaxID=1056816 RepID=UPI000464A1ED|nr:hypothetical protein [Nocardia sp. BMG51109]
MDDTTGPALRRSEADGREAMWKPARDLSGDKHVEIVEARDYTTGEHVMFTPGTDLVDAREQTSWRWGALWDRVHRAMWDEWVPSRRSSPGASVTRWI